MSQFMTDDLTQKIKIKSESENTITNKMIKSDNFRENDVDIKVEPIEDYVREPLIVIKEEINPYQWYDDNNLGIDDPLQDKPMDKEFQASTSEERSEKKENAISFDAIIDKKLIAADVLFSEARKKERRRAQSRATSKRYYHKNKNKEVDPDTKLKRREHIKRGKP